MQKYKQPPYDPINNARFSGTDKEEFLDFFGYTGEIVWIEKIGITYPDANYSVSRTVSNYIVLEYVAEGKGFVETDGIRYEVKEGDVYMLLPGSSHKYWADKNKPFKKLWINFFSDIFTDIIYKLQLNNTVVFHATPETGKLFSQLVDFAQTNADKDFLQVDMSTILYQIFMQLYKSNRSFLRNDNTDIATATLNWLNFYLFGTPTLQDLSRFLLVSEEYIIKQFKKKYGVTPHKYLLNKKISVAKNRLSNTNSSVREIAQQLGFENEHYFSKIFKQKTGLTPSAYRASVRKSPPPQKI